MVKHSNEYVKSETATAIDSVRVQMTILTNLGNKLRVIGYISHFCIDISYKRHPWVVKKRKKWIDLVEMASIGKPYESATAIDFEARFWLFLASRSHLKFSF